MAWELKTRYDSNLKVADVLLYPKRENTNIQTM